MCQNSCLFQISINFFFGFGGSLVYASPRFRKVFLGAAPVWAILSTLDVLEDLIPLLVLIWFDDLL